MAEYPEDLGSMLVELALFDPALTEEQLRQDIDSLRDWRARVADDINAVQVLADENFDLKLRLGLLVRLLISKGVITAEEYAKLIADFRPDESKPAVPSAAPTT